jgi:hypothetical protein
MDYDVTTVTVRNRNTDEGSSETLFGDSSFRELKGRMSCPTPSSGF